MRHTLAIVMLTGFLVGLQPQAVPDLSKVDRTIVKEPSNLSQPGYCLMVFGPRADVRIWMIKDGERLYVDRNANGDLTEPGESFAPTQRRQFNTMQEGKPAPYRELKYDVGDLTPAQGARKHTRFEITQYQIGDAPPDVVLSVFVDGSIKEYAGWSPLFHESRQRRDRPFWRADERAADMVPVDQPQRGPPGAPPPVRHAGARAHHIRLARL